MVFIEVSKAEFFGIIGPRNIHPRPERDCSIWEDVSTREVIGRTEPGYLRRLGRPERYWIADKYAAPQPAKEDVSDE